ncbi:hypothetical protein F5Y18DRAFT_437793 [Xylariaceae sp. FL1019]|nr:hypothetical protein F5Y18DRAFT_437793 [Xylariaceae sp. FL1019]
MSRGGGSSSTSNIPLSPWASRFPEVIEQDLERPVWILERGGQIHSGLAIEFPSRDPKFYNDPNPPDSAPTVPANGVDYDRLFVSEAHQKWLHRGLRSWEAATLNRWVHFEPLGTVSGGHLSSDDAEELQAIWNWGKISVNEDEWFPTFRRDHWHDLEDVPSAPAPEGGPWTVDNPGVWNELRIAIELANRILKALIDDRHPAIETLLFGRIVSWRSVSPSDEPFPDAHVLLSATGEAALAKRTNTGAWTSLLANASDETARLELQKAFHKVSDDLVWTFMSAPRGWSRGFTIRSTTPPTIALNLIPLRHLHGSDLTLAERCAIQWFFGKTILHELAHAIVELRYPGLIGEPFWDFEPVAEIGQAFEARIFGGRLGSTPIVGDNIPTASSLTKFPYLGGGKQIASHPALRHGAKVEREHIAAGYFSSMLSEHFWADDGVARKSDRYFHRNTMLFSETCINRRWPFQDVITDVQLDETDEDDWTQLDRKILKAWEDQHKQWRLERKNWYTGELRRWASTPWGYTVEVRRALEGFGRAFAAKNEADCRNCAVIMGVNHSTSKMYWADRQRFLNGMPTRTSPSSEWVFHAIGLLMLAALPVRFKRVNITNADYIRCVWTPSSGATKRGGKRSGTLRPGKTQTIMPSKFFDPFNEGSPSRAPGLSQERSPTQIEFLDLLDKMLDWIKERGSLISGPWYRRILHVSESLRLQRFEFEASYPNDYLSRYATMWEFTSPDYNPEDLDWIRWNPDSAQWDHFPQRPP